MGSRREARGHPDGDDPPTPPSLPEAVDLFTPEFVPQIAGGALAQFDEYRCFTVDLGLSEEAFVTGYEFIPGNKAMVHHVIATLVDPSAASNMAGLTNAEVIAQLREGQGEREGWSCFTTA